MDISGVGDGLDGGEGSEETKGDKASSFLASPKPLKPI